MAWSRLTSGEPSSSWVVLSSWPLPFTLAAKATGVPSSVSTKATIRPKWSRMIFPSMPKVRGQFSGLTLQPARQPLGQDLQVDAVQDISKHIIAGAAVEAGRLFAGQTQLPALGPGQFLRRAHDGAQVHRPAEQPQCSESQPRSDRIATGLATTRIPRFGKHVVERAQLRGFERAAHSGVRRQARLLERPAVRRRRASRALWVQGL